MQTGNCDLDFLVDYIHLLADRLIEFKIATRIAGYMLDDNIEKLAIEDVHTKGEEVSL